MKKVVWRYGPPPSIGWWPASLCENDQAIRWWDGNLWSLYAIPSCSDVIAAERARIKSSNQIKIKWTDRWWE